MKNGSPMCPKSMNEVARSSVYGSNIISPALSYLYDVEVVSLIECSPCGRTFEDMAGLEKHLAMVHKNTTRRFNLPSTTRTSEKVKARIFSRQHAVVDSDDEPLLDKAHAKHNGQACDQPNLNKDHSWQNRKASSSSHQIATPQEADAQQNGQVCDQPNSNKVRSQQNGKASSSSHQISTPQEAHDQQNGQACDQPNLNKAHSKQNGKTSSSSHQVATPQESVLVIDGNSSFKTGCTWCKKEFLYEPVDPETMTEACSFICPKCKEKLCGVLERGLLASCQK